MRNTLTLLTMALLLIPRAGSAQTPQAPQTATQTPVPQSSLSGHLDLGGLFTTTTGDEARFERYRDTRDGLYSGFGLHRDAATYRFDAAASHIGYRDQRYDAELLGRKANLRVNWTSIPLNYSYLTRTPFTTNGNVLSLPDALQAAVQGPTNSATDGSAVGVPCAPGAPPGACSTPAQAAQAIATRSIYNTVANRFDLEHLRHNAALAMTYDATSSVAFDGGYRYSQRKGTQPFGASFAFNNAVEIPLPLDQKTNDATLGATWGNERSSLRVGWDGSWFHNNIPSVTWDNPIFLTDFNNGLRPPNGPYDPNGYSNGNGPAKGRLAEAPSNWMSVVSTTGMYKLPARTTLNGTVQVTTQKQNEGLIPWTTNSSIDTPLVIAAFPHLAGLPRQTAEAEARGLNTAINSSTRLSRDVNLTVRYRYNKRDVRTPIFDATEYVRFDAVPEENVEGFSPQFDNSRHLFDAAVALTPGHMGTVRLGYGHEQIYRQGRGFADVGEHIFRVSYDIYSNQYVSVRTQYDYGRRRGSGFVEAESGTDDPQTITGPGGTQPTLRYFDEADRNRQRGSVTFTVMPIEMVDLYFQFVGGKDQYFADESVPVSRPGELFGLQQSTNSSWNVGLNLHPANVVSVGANYGRDRYGSLQRSRNANPPPDPTWTDPARDWTMDNHDRINNASAFLDLLRALPNTDIRVGYDFSDSNNAFVHGGPRIAALAAANQFIPLPNVTNQWQRFTADLQYFFSKKVGVGLGYYFDKLDVVDWNTIDTNGPVGFTPATGDPRIDWLGELNTGYGNRPYTGSTGTVRLIYHF